MTGAKGASTWGDPWWRYASITRSAGQMFFWKVTLPTTDKFRYVGFGSGSTTYPAMFYFLNDGTFKAANNSGAGSVIGTYAANTYYIALIVKATGFKWYIKGGIYTNWRYLYDTVINTAALIPGWETYQTLDNLLVDFIRFPADKYLFPPLISDGFSIAGISDGLAHAEGIAGGLGAGGEGVAWHYRDPYQDTKTLTLKGQLHCHSILSDGDQTPAAIVTAYRDAGYDFVALTDHYDGAIYPDVADDPGISGITFLKGTESGTTIGEMLCWNITTGRTGADQTIINASLAEGGLVGWPHPDRGVPITPTVTKNISQGMHLLEVYNYKVVIGFSEAEGDARDQWDNHLSVGRICYGFFADDCHDTPSFDHAWVVVHADSNTPAAIIDALKNGNFYGTQGPTLTQTFDKATGVITVTTSAASTIRFIGEGGAVLQTTPSVTSETYTLVGTELYVRAEVIRDSDSKLACGQPIMRDTWSIAGGKALNTPPLNDDVIVNGTFGADTDWSKDASWSIAAGVGTKVASADIERIYQTNKLTLYQVYKVTWDMLNRTAGGAYPALCASGGPTRQLDGSYVDYQITVNTTFSIYGNAAGALSIDNVTCQEVPLSSCIRGVIQSTSDTMVEVDLTVPDGSFGGLALNLDHPDYPSNFVLITVSRENVARIVAAKYVNGTRTQLFIATITYGAGYKLRVRNIGGTYYVYYNNLYVNNATVADTTVIDNLYIAKFSPDSNVLFDNFLSNPTGEGDEFGLFDKFIR
jgi:hypothetical protein